MKIRKFRAGDMVESASDSEEDKAKTAGLAASNAEKKSSGFLGLGRLFQGNIDEKGSEAYNKYGAGYGREVEAENNAKKAATLKATAAPATSAPAASAPAPVRIHKTAETKPAAAAAEAKYRGSSDYSDTADMKRNQSNVAGPSTTPGRGDKGARDTSRFKKPAAAPAASAPAAPAETKMVRRNLSVPNAAGPSAPAAAPAPAGARASTEQKSENSDADDTRLSFAERRKRAEMRAKKGSPTDTRSANERIKNALGLKKGGDIRGYASGGSVSSRADGIAQRGKTRGKMC